MRKIVLVRKGKVFVNGQFIETDILIENGLIKKIGKNIKSDAESIDASGLLIVPGLIDPHVHLREPGSVYK